MQNKDRHIDNKKLYYKSMKYEYLHDLLPINKPEEYKLHFMSINEEGRNAYYENL